MKKMKIYLASSWFTPATREILKSLESILDARSDVDLYSPGRDGVKLPENQKHDTALRTKIFNDNILHIKDADLIVANIYSGDTYNDTGTMYEIGYAIANRIPVLGFSPESKNISERFKGILGCMTVVLGYEELTKHLDNFYANLSAAPAKLLFIGSGEKDSDSRIATSILDKGINLRWLDDIRDDVYKQIDNIFSGVDCLLAVIDDRRTIVSWMIGQAYARGIPVVTYSNHNYGINIMLLVSVLTHLRGSEELDEFLHTILKSGLDSVPPFDISQIDAM